MEPAEITPVSGKPEITYFMGKVHVAFPTLSGRQLYVVMSPELAKVLGKEFARVYRRAVKGVG